MTTSTTDTGRRLSDAELVKRDILAQEFSAVGETGYADAVFGGKSDPIISAALKAMTRAQAFTAPPSQGKVERARAAASTFYEHIKHGDEKHRAWLKEECDGKLSELISQALTEPAQGRTEKMTTNTPTPALPSNVEELLPCPFCGGDDVGHYSHPHWLRCGKCEAEGPWAASHEDAVNSWNTRASTPTEKEAGELDVLAKRLCEALSLGDIPMDAELIVERLRARSASVTDAEVMTKEESALLDRALRRSVKVVQSTPPAHGEGELHELFQNVLVERHDEGAAEIYWEVSGPRKYLNIPSPVPDYWRAELHYGRGLDTKRTVAWGATEAEARANAVSEALASTPKAIDHAPARAESGTTQTEDVTLFGKCSDGGSVSMTGRTGNHWADYVRWQNEIIEIPPQTEEEA